MEDRFFCKQSSFYYIRFLRIYKDFFVFLTIFLIFAQNLFCQDENAKKREKFVNYAKQFLGCPYVFGAIGPDAFDCSGFVFSSARLSIGVQLPRKTSAIFSFCKPIYDDERQLGDLVFFKTTNSGQITHVGIYIGHEQFIHAASDGPNTGVIISSLHENYWKSHYFKSARFLDAGNFSDSKNSKSKTLNENSELNLESKNENENSLTKKDETLNVKNKFLEKISIEGTAFFAWNFFSEEKFEFVFRAVNLKSALVFKKVSANPFFALDLKWQNAAKIFQLGLEFGISPTRFFRLYFATLFTIGNPKTPSGKKIKPSIFPGTLGCEFQTPKIKIKKIFVCLVQDICVDFFKNPDGSALSPKRALGNGLSFGTGLRIGY